MGIRAPSTRRDSRFSIRLGSSVEFAEPLPGSTVVSADVVSVSVAGLAFQLEVKPAGVCRGASFDGLKIRVGQCIVEGKAVVRSILRRESGRIEVGCLFYPSPIDEDRWMALITGIGVATAHHGDEL